MLYGMYFGDFLTDVVRYRVKVRSSLPGNNKQGAGFNDNFVSASYAGGTIGYGAGDKSRSIVLFEREGLEHALDAFYPTLSEISS